jgi:invasion protein IalB
MLKMKKLLFSAAIVAVSAFTTPVYAQLLSATQISATENLEENKQDWIIFTDKDNQMMYIDFEKINIVLNSVVVKDSEGKVFFKDDALSQLPLNSIYEIDYSKFPKGEFNIELKSFAGILNKKISIQ